MACKGICHRYKAKKPGMNSRYEAGQKHAPSAPYLLTGMAAIVPAVVILLEQDPRERLQGTDS
ncbi:hypothetical protein [Nitrosopumilus sp.]|uniref:hypothetical protein n=1 Tax=Nitrosopumilus sp. TaxID=2024843 RepID=UPI00293182AA|nr:hypothetical protein [Nitrosopumilus sp.]